MGLDCLFILNIAIYVATFAVLVTVSYLRAPTTPCFAAASARRCRYSKLQCMCDKNPNYNVLCDEDWNSKIRYGRYGQKLLYLVQDVNVIVNVCVCFMCLHISLSLVTLCSSFPSTSSPSNSITEILMTFQAKSHLLPLELILQSQLGHRPMFLI